MKKSEIIEAIATDTGLTKTAVGQVYDSFLNLISRELAAGNEVRIPGLGSLILTQRAERMGRNPRTGEAVKINPSKSVRFKPGKTLKDAVNAG